MKTLFGISIVPHTLACSQRTERVVEKWPIAKRRRGWRVVARVVTTPGAMRVGNTLCVHPEVLGKMREVLEGVNPNASFSRGPSGPSAASDSCTSGGEK